jgi:CHRD domain
VLVTSMLLSGPGVSADDDPGRFSATLRPEQEVPVVSSQARGSILLDIDEDAQEIAFELSYSGLLTTVAQAHIHIAQPGVNGGIVLWLCEVPRPRRSTRRPRVRRRARSITS